MRIRYSLMLCALFLIPSVQAVRAAEDPLVEVNREIGVAAQGLLTNYKENFPQVGGVDQSGDRELGWIPGVTGRASTMFDAGSATHLFVSAQVSFLDGDVFYKGGLQLPNGEHGDDVTADNIMRKAMGTLQIGKGFTVGADRLMIIPFIEYGRQRWGRTLTGPGAYYEAYLHNWVGAGVRTEYRLTAQTILGASAMLGGTFRNRLSLSMSPGNAFNLCGRPIWSIGLGIDRKILPHLHVFTDASFRHISNGNTHVLPILITTETATFHTFGSEPPSWTQELSVEGGVAWSY